MKIAHWLLLTGALLAVTAIMAAEISIDADRTADFSAFKTYAWKANDKASDPLADAAIVADIEEQLAAKGLTKADKTPDLFVIYHAILSKDAKLTDWDEGKFKLENRNITVEKLTVGTLMVDLVDARTGKLLWRAASTDTLKVNYFTKDFAEGLKKNIALMFTMYPPKKN